MVGRSVVVWFGVRVMVVHIVVIIIEIVSVIVVDIFVVVFSDGYILMLV